MGKVGQVKEVCLFDNHISHSPCSTQKQKNKMCLVIALAVLSQQFVVGLHHETVKNIAALMQSLYVAALVFVQVATLSYFLLDRTKEPNIFVLFLDSDQTY
jgi:hypothetical protein